MASIAGTRVLSQTTQCCVRLQTSIRPAFRPLSSQQLCRGLQKPIVGTIARRWHSSPSQLNKQYEFDKIRELSQSPSTEERIIIDVREPAEYEAGYIPGAVNIPVKTQPDAIFLSPEEFEDRFGFSKPSQESEVIFYCRSGVRSSAAAQLAQQQGYKNISEYRGSWLDWEKNGGPIAKP